MTAFARELLFAALAQVHPGAPGVPPVPLQAIPARHGRTGRHPTWSQATVLAALQAFVARTGHFPRRTDWSQARALGLPAYATARKLFGTMAACEAAYWTHAPRETPP